ncbi:hypothetical protein CPB84DRAFT_1746771 [Gymnopilus junonius]|uniref:Uncharacterized protein n=1 Tax=Gymnopilus junonius TaxID=109634 RepID=A0A9P5NSG1_GYMJU|nr:hypothetical protein CPB84DRAFT_1746771 [Gymnopilus junonius]
MSWKHSCLAAGCMGFCRVQCELLSWLLGYLELWLLNMAYVIDRSDDATALEDPYSPSPSPVARESTTGTLQDASQKAFQICCCFSAFVFPAFFFGSHFVLNAASTWAHVLVEVVGKPSNHSSATESDFKHDPKGDNGVWDVISTLGVGKSAVTGNGITGGVGGSEK